MSNAMVAVVTQELEMASREEPILQGSLVVIFEYEYSNFHLNVNSLTTCCWVRDKTVENLVSDFIPKNCLEILGEL